MYWYQVTLICLRAKNISNNMHKGQQTSQVHRSELQHGTTHKKKVRDTHVGKRLSCDGRNQTTFLLGNDCQILLFSKDFFLFFGGGAVCARLRTCWSMFEPSANPVIQGLFDLNRLI